MKVLEIAYTAYAVSDMPRAKAFYDSVLGLRPTGTWGEPGKFEWVEYDIGPGTIALVVGGGDDWKPSSNGAVVALEVDDFDAFAKHIKAKGAKVVLDAVETPVCHFMTVADPDGNRIFIHKRKAR